VSEIAGASARFTLDRLQRGKGAARGSACRLAATP